MTIWCTISNEFDTFSWSIFPLLLCQLLPFPAQEVIGAEAEESPGKVGQHLLYSFRWRKVPAPPFFPVGKDSTRNARISQTVFNFRVKMCVKYLAEAALSGGKPSGSSSSERGEWILLVNLAGGEKVWRLGKYTHTHKHILEILRQTALYSAFHTFGPSSRTGKNSFKNRPDIFLALQGPFKGGKENHKYWQILLFSMRIVKQSRMKRPERLALWKPRLVSLSCWNATSCREVPYQIIRAFVGAVLLANDHFKNRHETAQKWAKKAARAISGVPDIRPVGWIQPVEAL